MQESTIQNITPDKLFHLVTTSKAPVLIDVWGKNCAPCKAVEELLLRHLNGLLRGVVVYKICGQEFPDWCAHNDIRHVPTVLLYSSGVLLNRETQLLSDGQLQRFMAAADLKAQGANDNLDELLRSGQYSVVRAFLNQLPGETLRTPYYQRASSMLAMHDMPLDASLASVRNDFITSALNNDWEVAVKTLYTTVVASPNYHELQSLSFALLDLLPDRLLAQRWRREFHRISSSF